MGRVLGSIDERLAGWMESQPIFFVATVGRDPASLLNCSPKGNRGELAVLDPVTVVFLDQTGSGIETVAHLRDDGRIVMMFCAFDGPPRIVRIHGTGDVIARDAPDFDRLTARFPAPLGVAARSVVVIKVARVADSCGFGVPLMHFEAHRTQLESWAERKGEQGIRDYWAEKNARSIDGLVGLSGFAGD